MGVAVKILLCALVLAHAAVPYAPAAYAQGLGVEVRDDQGTIIGRQGAGGDPFELGFFAAPIIGIDAALLAALFLHRKGRLKAGFASRFLVFEVSKKTAAIAAAAILAVYAGLSAGEIAEEETFSDYDQLRHDVETWPNKDVGVVGASYLLSIDYMLFWVSLYVFGNIRLIPFLASIALLAMTYVLTAEMGRKRLAGLVAMAVLAQSRTFLDFDTTVSYDNFWILFYVVSLYMILKHRQAVWSRFSPALYYLSIASKPLAAAFAPMSLYFIYMTEFGSGKRKLWAAVPYMAIAAVMAALVLGRVAVSSTAFNPAMFWDGINAWPVLLSQDGFFLVLVLPLVAALYVKARGGVLHAGSIMFFLAVNLWLPALLAGSTEISNTAYRAVPLLVFFAMGTGMLFATGRKEGAGRQARIAYATLLFALSIVVLADVSAVLPALIPGIVFAD